MDNVIDYLEYYEKLSKSKNKTKITKERLNKLYIWVFNGFIKTNLE